MKTLEHEIRDVMSRKKEKDLIEEVNNNFINMIENVYGKNITKEQFIQLYELYIIHLNEDGTTPSSILSKTAKVGGRALGPGIEGLDRYSKDQPWYHVLGGTVASTLGGIGGAALGSSIGPVGTVAGGITGGVAAGELYDRAFGLTTPSTEKGRGAVLGGTVGYKLADAGHKALDSTKYGRTARVLGTAGGAALGYGLASAANPDQNAKPPAEPAKSAPTPPPVSPPGSKENSPIAVDPLSGTVTNISNDKKQQPLDKKQIEYTNRGFSQTPTPASTNVSRQPEMKTSLAGGATNSRMSVPTPPKTTQPDTKPATTAQPSTATKSQEPPESARKQKPSTSSDSSYSGRSIGDYGKDNSWVQQAFNRG